ncbi:hypothetical protein JTB14_011060 [Gonioctena quinquepunctata]|nr:hypothetical protein JTB14_011060 [Gonioctena quinquepunctata]
MSGDTMSADIMEDRSRNCFRCGEAGHKTTECTMVEHCLLCKETHKTGTAADKNTDILVIREPNKSLAGKPGWITDRTRTAQYTAQTKTSP